MTNPTAWEQKHALKSRRYGLLVAALTSLVLAACGGGGGGSSDSSPSPTPPVPAPVTLSADVYPLAAGDRRTWRVSSGSQMGGLRSERAGEAVQLEGQAAWPVRSEDGEVEYFARTATGVLSVPGAGADPLAKALGPVELLRFGQVAGTTAELLKRTLTIDLNGDGRADSVDILIESTFSGYESVTTAAGSFPAAARLLTVARITTRVTGNANIGSLIVSAEEWFAPGIGPVRSVTTTTSTAQPTETETEELLAYGIGIKRSETVAPTLLSSNLTPDSVLPSAPANIELNFSEALDPLTLDGGAGLSLVDSSGQLLAIGRTLADGGKRVTLSPLAALPDGRYELRLGSGLTDLANNPLAPSVRAFSVDSRGPRITSSTPADGSDEAAISGNIVLNFNEAIFAPDGSNKVAINFLTDFFGGERLMGEIQGSSIVLTLDKALTRNREYTLTLGTALKDAAGNVVPSGDPVIRFKTGPGPFARATPLMTNAQVTALAIGDINGDGRPDIVFSGAQNATLYDFFIGARLQQADGSYAPAIRLYQPPPYTTLLTNALSLADVDGDGRVDIIMSFANGVTALMQQAAGEFVSEVVDANASIAPNAALDLDGDGRKEVVVSGRDLRIMRREPNGVWRAVLAVGGPSDYLSSYRLADLNGDGQLDLAWMQRSMGTNSFEIFWALRQGSGFGPVQNRTYVFAGDLIGWSTLAVADVTGDGRPDMLLLLPESYGGRVAVLAQTATGDLATPVLYPTQGSALETADVNGDGRIDVLVTDGFWRWLGVLLQAADGSLEPVRPFAINHSNSGYGNLVVLDTNADGRVDIVTGNAVLLGRPVSGAWPAAAPGTARRLSLGSGAGPASLSVTPSQTKARGKKWLKHLRSLGLERAAI